ncbi:hypothetical protein Q9L58_010684, partial [Maublancomyces gigas]
MEWDESDAEEESQQIHADGLRESGVPEIGGNGPFLRLDDSDSEPDVELEFQQPVDGVRDPDVGNGEIFPRSDHYTLVYETALRCVYLPVFKVLLCIECRYALTRSNLVHHFHQKHGQYSIDLKELKKLGEKYDIVDREAINYPSPDSPEVPHLHLNRNGFRCNLCSFACGKISTIQRHVGKSHKDSDLAAAQRWSGAAVQTFFCTPGVHYFVVTPNEPLVRGTGNNIDLDSLLHAHTLLLQRAPNELSEMDHILHLGPGADQLSPWLKETGWHKHLEGLDLETVASVVCRVKKDGTGFEKRVVTSMRRIFARCSMDILNEASYYVVRLANSTEAGRPSSSPFKLTQNTASHKRYLKYWIEFVKYIVTRESLPEEVVHLLHLTEEQSGFSQTAVDLLHDPKSSDENLDLALARLSMSFIRHRLIGNQFRSALIHYVALMAVNPITKGLAETPRGQTTILAAIRYCSRLLGISDAIRTWEAIKDDGTGRSPLDLFRNDHTNYFSAG